MPDLDVTEVLDDPDFADTFILHRMEQSVTNRGRVVNTAVDSPNQSGVFTSAGPNDLMRLPEEQRTGRAMCLVTRVRLRATSAGFSADEITWDNSRYIVMALDPYHRYGAGFVQAIISSVDSQDNPPN